MISVTEAQEKILDTVSVRPGQKLPLKCATGRFSAKAISAPHDAPSFDNSAMDGYAIRSEDAASATSTRAVSLQVTHTVAAGDDPLWELQTGEAARIFTGAMIPAGADAVIAQEEVRIKDQGILIEKPVPAGQHIRWHGEELRRGDPVSSVGDLLSPARIGLLASLGIREVSLYSPPRIGIVVTGSEIVTATRDFAPGKIFDSNSFALTAALQELHLFPSFVKHCPDSRQELLVAIENGFNESDFLIVTGGVSVGDYDFVKDCAHQQGVEEIFWQVKQKPGKPLFFGKKNDSQYLFGLPGNPASVLVCFYEYVRPAVLRAMGHPRPLLPQRRVPLKKAYRKQGGRTHFLRARYDGDVVEILEQQGSHIMLSFAEANCLAMISEAHEQVEAGEAVEVLLLPGTSTLERREL